MKVIAALLRCNIAAITILCHWESPQNLRL